MHKKHKIVITAIILILFLIATTIVHADNLKSKEKYYDFELEKYDTYEKFKFKGKELKYNDLEIVVDDAKEKELKYSLDFKKRPIDNNTYWADIITNVSIIQLNKWEFLVDNLTLRFNRVFKYSHNVTECGKREYSSYCHEKEIYIDQVYIEQIDDYKLRIYLDENIDSLIYDPYLIDDIPQYSILYAYLPMNTGTGTTVYNNVSGAELGNFLMNGNPTWNTTFDEYGVDFDGTNDYLQSENSLSEFLPDTTICMWVNPRQNQAGEWFTWGQKIYFRQQTSCAGSACFEIRWDASGTDCRMFWYEHDSIALNTWSHMCFVVDTNDDEQCYVYQNGTLVYNNTVTGSLSQNTEARIGTTTGGAFDVNGTIDLFMWWEGNLNASAISEVYNETYALFSANETCSENWVKDTIACETNNTNFITYTDSNNCNTTTSLPADNGTYSDPYTDCCYQLPYPTGLNNQSQNNDSIYFVWNNVTNWTDTKFQLFNYTGALMSATYNLNHNETNLNNNSFYNVSIRAFDNSGTCNLSYSDYSPYIETYTLQNTDPQPPPVLCSQPATISDLSHVSNTTSTITVSWTTVTGAEKYLMFRDGINVANDTAPNYQYISLTNFTQYNLTIKAYNSTCTVNTLANVSNTLFATTQQTNPPSEPSPTYLNLTSISCGTETNSTIPATWTTSGNYTYSEARIQGQALLYNNTAKAYTFTGLDNNTAYTINITVYYNATLFDSDTLVCTTEQNTEGKTPLNLLLDDNSNLGMWIFLLQFIGISILFLLKFYNVMSKALFYDLKMMILISGIVLVLFGIGFINYMIHATVTLVMIMFSFETLIFLVIVLFTLLEMFLYMELAVVGDKTKSRSNKRTTFINRNARF